MEAHVCVLQTVLGLLDRSRRAYVVADAIGSRRPDSKAAALARLERAGAEIVTTEMVLFEWLGTAEDPKFKPVIGLVK
jgi:nicotinamidase-related amidase